MLSSIDTLRGRERQQALERALGVTVHDINNQFKGGELSEEVLALRKFAEAVEAAVRGGDQGALGLNWDASEV
jgi:zinc finger HIT domain-containing protein 3